MSDAKRICKNENCKNELTGRVDRVFCSSYCKSDYHYHQRKESGKVYFKNKVDDVLRNNRKILSKYNTKSKVTIRKEDLLEEGFNPRFFTHYWKNKNGDTYLFCYDQGFKEIHDNYRDKYLLIQWQDYMEKQAGF